MILSIRVRKKKYTPYIILSNAIKKCEVLCLDYVETKNMVLLICMHEQSVNMFEFLFVNARRLNKVQTEKPNQRQSQLNGL